jgi:L,D-peptidoglycan transpeptidase YkuD (ErfK/YbiS/YcfS/YnhG family)
MKIIFRPRKNASAICFERRAGGDSGIPMTRNLLTIIPGQSCPHSATARWRGKSYACAVGKAGVVKSHHKREGDGATPAGLFAITALYYRADRLQKPLSALPAAPITVADGWCDGPADAHYNQPVKLPCNTSAEALWRDDPLYDVILATNHNQNPAKPGLGSACFIHVARDDLSGTRGCVALAKNDLLEIIKDMGPETMIRIKVAQSDL